MIYLNSPESNYEVWHFEHASPSHVLPLTCIFKVSPWIMSFLILSFVFILYYMALGEIGTWWCILSCSTCSNQVAVEGNIGSGKTCLLNHFADCPYAEVHTEPVAKWRDIQGHNALVRLIILYSNRVVWRSL
jgi:hypothetical protein